jgi:hypothetical protein
MIRPQSDPAGSPRRRGVSAAIGALMSAATVGMLLLATPTMASAATTDDIKLAQTDLNGLAYNAGPVDGTGGPQTSAATQAFQDDRCLTVDGVIGPQTLGGLQGMVKQVQTKAGITADGQYDAGTRTAVTSYQSAHNLTADGIAGPDTMASMGITRIDPSCHSSSGLGAKIVGIAKSQLGTVADANNCVPGKPYSICADWCAAFATWVWRDAGVNIPAMNYVPSVYDWAVSHGKWYGTGQLNLAKPGYLIIFGTATNRYHIGVVDHVSGGTVYVISGNTRNPNNSSQHGVFDKSYPLSASEFYGLVHL